MIRQVIYVFMGILYTAMGVFVMAKEWFLTDLTPVAAKALGILFILYGLFRIYRAVKSIRTRSF